jgi:transposase
MVWQELLPRVPGIELASVEVLGGHVVVHAATAAPVATCPRCSTPSRRVHSRYVRTLTDKPLGGRGLRVLVTVRRFVCSHGPCPRAVFAEAVDDLAPPRARTTADLADAHTAIGFAAGGEPGARLARDLDMPTSPDTILRRVKAKSPDPGPPPRYVGIDDWAVRKGRNYGTAVIDLERARVIALLPGRDGEALAEWLRKNPQVEVITRDRWPAYAKTAADAAPQARQVADRWHLLKNLREAVEEVLARMTPEVRAAATPEPAPSASEPTTATPDPSPAPEPTTAAPPGGAPAATAREARRQAKRDLRLRVLDLKAEGWSARRIAAHLRLARATVSRLLRRPVQPHGNAGRRGPSVVDAHRADVDAWLAAGHTNTADLHRTLKAKGCKASYHAVHRYATRRRDRTGMPGPRAPKGPTPAARKSRRRGSCRSSSSARRRRETRRRSWTASGGGSQRWTRR